MMTTEQPSAAFIAALPDKALSVRQPWAWGIAHGGKPYENRDWSKANPALAYRGPICIHASLGMTRDEYAQASDFMHDIGVACPAAALLQRGGIIAKATVVDVVRASDSPWFFGPLALVLEDVEPVPFIACTGALGFFDWRQGIHANGAAVPAKWMREELTLIERRIAATIVQTTLFGGQ